MTMPNQWKVVIADDEVIIREGVRDAIDWDGLSFTLCGEASDGEEAVELCVDMQADILLVDINMPIMNGIEVIAALKQQLPTCKFVIISGHDEFGFAQEAIRYEVSEYILKPVTPEQLNRVLGNLKQRLQDEKQKERFVKLASDQIEQNIPLLRQRFFINWLREGMTRSEVLEQLQFLGLPVATPKQIVVLRCSELLSNQLYTEKDRQLMLFSIENIVSEMIDGQRFALLRNMSDQVVVFNWNEISEEKLVEIEKAIQHYLKLGLTVKAQTITGDIEEVPNLYFGLLSAVQSENKMSPIVKRARQFITENYRNNDLTLEKVANEIFVTPVYLSRVLKQELGTTFMGLLSQLRMQRAVQLLNSSDLSILEISESCGYESQHYFSTAFKKVMGVSPNQYRKGMEKKM
jgi:two-component system response regulator YesN